MVDDVVIGIPAAGFGILSVLFTAGIRASVEHHIAAGLILDCRSGVGHVVHRAVAGDGQSALVGNRVVLLVGQGLSVQIEGQLRSFGDYDILRRILEQSNRLALPGVVDRLLEAGVVLAAHLGHTVLHRHRSNHPIPILLYHAAGWGEILTDIAGECTTRDHNSPFSCYFLGI